MPETHTSSDQSADIAVIGAGIVGISSALLLQRQGYRVHLLDRSAVAQETSFGNAGLLATSTLLPLNHPGLWRQIPTILSRQSNYVNFNWRYMLRNSPALTRYLREATQARTHFRASLLKSLIYRSIELHQQWLHEAEIGSRLRTTGWLKLYASAALYRQAQREHQWLKRYAVDAVPLDSQGIYQLEPDVAEHYTHGLWIRDTPSLDDPGAVCQGYFELFAQAGGRFQQADVTRLHRSTPGTWIIDSHGQSLSAERIVITLGAWSRNFLLGHGIRIPMLYERGAHRMYDLADTGHLSRPVYDAEAGFVVSPMESGCRLTCGVFLADLETSYDWSQLEHSEQVAQARLPLGRRRGVDSDWTGCRPTLPDYLPIIGETRLPGVWLNTGHHHIGMTMAPASAQHLVDLMTRPEKAVNNPFAADRFD